MISVEAGPARAYRVGEAIEGTDASVRSLHPGHVVLDRGGRHETLSLEKPVPGAGDDSTADAASLPQPGQGPAGSEEMLQRFRDELKKRGRQAASK